MHCKRWIEKTELGQEKDNKNKHTSKNKDVRQKVKSKRTKPPFETVSEIFRGTTTNKRPQIHPSHFCFPSESLKIHNKAVIQKRILIRLIAKAKIRFNIICERIRLKRSKTLIFTLSVKKCFQMFLKVCV